MKLLALREKVHAYILQRPNQLVGCGQFIVVWTGMYSVLESPGCRGTWFGWERSATEARVR